MAQNISLQGFKAQTISAVEHKSTEQKAVVRYYPIHQPLLEPSSRAVRAPVHSDFTSFMASSVAVLQGSISDASKMAARVLNSRFGPEEPAMMKPQIPTPSKTVAKESLSPTSDKNAQTPMLSVPKLIEALGITTLVQPKIQAISDKGYGARIQHNPMIAMASVSDLDKFSMGLLGGVQQRANTETEDHPKGFEKADQKLKSASKPQAATRPDQSMALRREQVEALREVNEKFLQQLKAKHPHISVPINHPEGIVDVHMRFDRKSGGDGTKGSVRVMFTGSNPEIVSLFVQHRENFIKTITSEGYEIDPSRMQFNTISSSKS